MITIIVSVLLQIAIGLLYSNFLEWALHNFVLHKLGKKFRKVFGFHWFVHHRNSRLNNFYDKEYDKGMGDWNSHTKETFALSIVWAMHFWAFFVFPVFAVTITYCTINYYLTHKWAHQNPEWAKENLRHHWEHHMCKDQNANYCVTKPWFDYILGTRVKYVENSTKSTKPLEVNNTVVQKPVKQTSEFKSNNTFR